MASYLHRTAQPSTLATFRSWGSSTGAGRIRLAEAKIIQFAGSHVIFDENQKEKPGLSDLELTTVTPIS
jgi:hypothetical protein